MNVSPLASTGYETSAPTAAGAKAKHVVVVASLTKSLVNFRLELLKAMVDAGHRVTALAPDQDADSISALHRIGVAFEAVPMQRTGSNPLADLKTLTALYRCMRALAPDLVLAYTMKPIIYGCLAARLAGVRRRFALFTGLGQVFSESAQSQRAVLLRKFSVRLYRSALVGAEAAFAYNDADAEDIRHEAILGPETPLVMIDGSGVDLELFPRRSLPSGDPVFLLVARLLREKGVAEFAAAARLLKEEFPHARFQILGPQERGAGAISPTELHRWVSQGTLEYLGETSDVRPYLAASTVFVLPSYYREGIPRSALEALSTGRPIITTTAPGCRETVIKGANGHCVAPRDIEQLAGAMRAFLTDATLAPRMSARSRELAEARFDVHKVNAQLLYVLGLSRVAERL